ncbi:hypothetical protein DFJ74DRAFT_631482 [Hyaloraphidium curvatum]|nr:hypothetical protein DFJ74DRAFT_631482 [Hyaloraphidium curvatum]
MSQGRIESLQRQFSHSAVASKPASRHTIAANASFAARLNLEDPRDFADATRGLIEAERPLNIKHHSAPNVMAWSMEKYSFIDEQGAKAPDTVNPSLWRQARLNEIHGFFEVVPGKDRGAGGIYQVRGYDISNMTLIEGETGVIVIDPAISVECAGAMLDVYRKHRGARPVSAVIFTHSHVDHFGGVEAVLPRPDADGKYPIPIIAPVGFMEHAVAENVLAGAAMTRRAMYMYGEMLTPGERSQVDCGLGKATSKGRVSLVEPNVVIEGHNGHGEETMVVDGVEIVFYLCPESEAPAEFIMFYPATRVLNMSEVACHTLHNLYTLRGAQIRDGQLWSSYITHALVKYAENSDICIAQHHWPTFGRDRIKSYLESQRDIYKMIHDQTLRLANSGFTPIEISEALRLPKGLENEWSVRDYYGTLSHNAKATYQKYLGWYDGNPANLNPLSPVASAKKTVEYMGGAAAILEKARRDFENGEYRWVASITNQVVFADPSDTEARHLCADAMEQLAYIAESGPWRNVYLQGAFELRNSVVRPPGTAPRPGRTAPPHVLSAMGLGLVLDFAGVRLNYERAENAHLVFDFQCTGEGEKRFIVNVQNGVLTYTDEIPHGSDNLFPYKRPDFTIAARQRTIRDLLQGGRGPQALAELVARGEAKVSGDPARLAEFASYLDTFEMLFPIVEP